MEPGCGVKGIWKTTSTCVHLEVQSDEHWIGSNGTVSGDSKAENIAWKDRKEEDWSIETNSLWHFPNLPIDCEGMVVSSGFYPEAAVSLRDVWIVPPRTEQHNACRTNVGISGLILNQTAKDAPKPNCRHSYHQLKEYLGVCTPFIS